MACYNRQPPPSRKDAPMTTPGPDLYTRLLASSQDAFAAEFYEVAYHALMAAPAILQQVGTRHKTGRCHPLRSHNGNYVIHDCPSGCSLLLAARSYRNCS